MATSINQHNFTYANLEGDVLVEGILEDVLQLLVDLELVLLRIVGIHLDVDPTGGGSC